MKQRAHELQLMYVLDHTTKKSRLLNIPKENKPYKKFVKKIYRKSNKEILSDIKDRVKELTPEFMNKEIGIIDFYIDIEKEEEEQSYGYYRSIEDIIIDWIMNLQSVSIEMIETILQVYRLFDRIGIKLELQQAEFIWYQLSLVISDSWIRKCDDETAWWMILTGWVYHNKLV